MKVTMILADHAVAENGKLYINGGGWTFTGPPAPWAIAMLFEVPWDQANDKQRIRLELVDADGHPVIVDTPEGGQPVVIDGEFETGRPPGMKRGTPVTFPVAFNSGPLPLEPDTRYEWRLSWNEQSHDDWRLAFSTRPEW
jgi:hypothetical protein